MISSILPRTMSLSESSSPAIKSAFSTAPIRLMKIFDDSKTFIVNDEVENTVGQIKVIMQKPAPYSDIFKLPALLDQYIRAYDEVLQTMEEPVLAAIEDAKSRVFAELEGKESKPQFMGKFAAKFQELHDKATSSNNVATLQNIKVEADALKVRCLNEISDAETKILARKAAEQAQRRAQADAAQTASGKRPENANARSLLQNRPSRRSKSRRP